MHDASLTDIHSTYPTSTTPLGYAVFWRLSGVKVQHDELADLLTTQGLRSYLPDSPTPSIALRRALIGWCPAPALVRTITKTPLVLAVVQEQANQQGLGLTHQTWLRVCYDNIQHDILCTRTASGPIDQQTLDVALTMELRSRWQEACRMLLGEDLARLLRAILHDLHAVRLQRGVYFVHVRHQARLQQLDALVRALPGSPLLATLERIDDRKTRQHLVHQIHAELVSELHGMEEELHHLLAVPQPSLPAVTQRLARFRLVHQKACIYADLLAERFEQITQQIEQVRQQAGQVFLFGADSFADLGTLTGKNENYR